MDFSYFRAAKGKFVLAALLTGFSFSGICKPQSDSEIIAHVLKEGSLQRYVEELKTPVVISYKGQKYYLESAKSEMVALAADAPAGNLPELEVLKFVTKKNGAKAKLKMQMNDTVVKTIACVCPSEPSSCQPCSNWQIKFLSTRKQNNKLPDNFLFVS